MSQKVNLNAYFDRIGFAGSIAPTLATLETITALHPAVIPFENLNPLLGLPVELDLKAIEKKLLGEKRGGYCYEHNLLLGAVLRELDFPVKNLAARVLWNNPDGANQAPTHMLLAVEISGASYIVDAGFGMTLTGPLRLRADVEQTTPHQTYRLSETEGVWTLEGKVGEEWKPSYMFDLTEQSQDDYEAANLKVSTDPQSGFVQELRVALSPPGKRLALRNNRLTTYLPDAEPQVETLTDLAGLKDVLTGTFGITLPSSEQLDPKLDAIIAAESPEN